MATPRLAPVATHPLTATSAQLRCEIVTSFDRLASFAADWKHLWTADPRAEIFQTFEFAHAWWNAYEDTVRLRTAVVRRGTDVIGILPLVQRCRILRFLGAPEFDYNDVICREEDTIQVLALALRSLCDEESWDEIELGNLASTSRIMRYWSSLRKELPLTSLIVPGAKCPTILLDRGREDALRTVVSSHHHKRHKNKLRKLGHLSFRHVEAADEALLHLQQFFRQQIRRRALCETHSRFHEKGFRRMCQSLIREFDPSKELRLGVLELDGRPLAYGLGFEVNGKFLLYQQSFDIDDWHLAVGDVLVHSLFEYAQGQGVHEFDFSVGMESYKEKFANEIKRNHELHLYRVGISGRSRQLKQLAISRGALLSERLSNITDALSSFLRESRLSRAATAWLARHGRLLAKYELLFEDAGSMKEEGNPRRSAMLEGTDLHFRSVRLSELADLSLEYAEILTREQLVNLCDRIRAGERIWVGFSHNELVVLVAVQPQLKSVSERTEVSASSDAGTTSQFVIDEIWASGKYRHPDNRRGLLLALLRCMNRSCRYYVRSSLKMSKR